MASGTMYINFATLLKMAAGTVAATAIATSTMAFVTPNSVLAAEETGTYEQTEQFQLEDGATITIYETNPVTIDDETDKATVAENAEISTEKGASGLGSAELVEVDE